MHHFEKKSKNFLPKGAPRKCLGALRECFPGHPLWPSTGLPKRGLSRSNHSITFLNKTPNNLPTNIWSDKVYTSRTRQACQNKSKQLTQALSQMKKKHTRLRKMPKKFSEIHTFNETPFTPRWQWRLSKSFPCVGCIEKHIASRPCVGEKPCDFTCWCKCHGV